MLQDITFGLRTIGRNKAVTAIAVLCLAIGIGLNTMMFSVVDGVLIQPLPYRDPGRLIVLRSTNQRSGIRRGNLSWLDVKDWRERSTSYAALAGLETRSFTLGDQLDPQRYSGAAIGHELFPMLGVAPQLGRVFRADDDKPGAEPVVMLSDSVWRLRYRADRSLLGRSILVNSRPHTVVGIMPPHFRFPRDHDVWLPLAEYAASDPRDARDLQVFGRLKPEVPLERARQEADAVAARLAVAYPQTNHGWGAYVQPVAEWAIPSDVRTIITAMMGAVTFVLLIACFNVANLMLARASTRAREISIRTALGAGRSRILRQLLTESVLVGLLSVPLGMAIAWIAMRWLNASMPLDAMPYFVHWELNGRAFAYTLAMALLTGILFGLVPAIQASKANLQETLKEGGRGTAGGGQAWIRNVLVVGEVALSLVLLVGASLFVRSFLNLQEASGGFDAKPLLTLRFYLPEEQFPTDESKTQRVDDIVTRVEALPGVQAAFASNMVPLSGGGSDADILIENRTTLAGEEPNVGFTAVTPHMLRVLGLPVVRGRDITDAEARARTPVALVNQAMVKKLWPHADPLGHRFRVKDKTDWFTIVGVVPDFRHGELDDNQPIDPCAYVPFVYGAFPNTGLTIRTAGDPSELAGAVRQQIRRADPSIAVFQVSTMETLRERGYWQYRLFGWMFSMWGLVALLLAAVGVYGVLSYSVAQRTSEIGVRMALGAGRRDVLALVLAQGGRLAMLGVVLGLAGSFGITRFVATILYNVSATDPLSFVVVAVFLALVALVASYVPARRAMAVDPLVALRTE
ncbi:MAG TPA: ABC transporter permease [Vicinamibacterales bacterium]|nr:ABC transporter permease [Vicinamibacterales bacterium]